MITVVCGKPGSGKSTICETRRQAGDIVWDFDKIAATLHPELIDYANRESGFGRLAVRWRRILCDELRAGKIKRDAWIIVTDRQSATTLWRSLFGARLVDAEHNDHRS